MALETGLANYLTTLYDEWKENRSVLEAKWQKNLKAIKGKDSDTWKKGEAETWRSKTFIKIVKVKVFVAFSILTDIFLQGGIVPFALKHSPFEEAKLAEEEGGEETTGNDEISEDISDMTAKIREQLTDRKADREYLKKILSLCYYGEAYSKYTIKDIKETGYRPSVGIDDGGNEVELAEYPELIATSKQIPGHEYRSVWTIVSDPENGDLQKNRGTFEKDLASPFDLLQKKGGKFYIDEAIKEVISEYIKADSVKDRETLKPGLREVKYRKKTIDSSEFWGRAPRSLVEDFERDKLGRKIVSVNPDWMEDEGDEVEIIAEIADGVIIRFARREMGAKRPYKKCYMEDALDEDYGVSIADNMEDIKVSVNGMVRAFEDNKKLSGNVMMAIKRRFLLPTVTDELFPGKTFECSEACDDVRKAFNAVVIPDVGESLLSGIAMMEKWGDVVSQVPTIAQGFSLAKHKPDTLGEVQLMMENLGKYFGMVIRNIDEGFVEPEITDLYDYNMRDESYQGQKSDMKISATGFTSFHDKIIRIQKIREVLTIALTDQSGLLLREIKIRPHLEEIYKGLDIDIDQFLKTEDEKKVEDEKNARARLAEEERLKEEAVAIAEKEVMEKEEDFQRDVLKKQIEEATA